MVGRVGLAAADVDDLVFGEGQGGGVGPAPQHQRVIVFSLIHKPHLLLLLLLMLLLLHAVLLLPYQTILLLREEEVRLHYAV